MFTTSPNLHRFWFSADTGFSISSFYFCLLSLKFGLPISTIILTCRYFITKHSTCTSREFESHIIYVQIFSPVTQWKKQTNYFCKWYFNTTQNQNPTPFFFFALIICISHLKLKNDLALQVSLPDGQV